MNQRLGGCHLLRSNDTEITAKLQLPFNDIGSLLYATKYALLVVKKPKVVLIGLSELIILPDVLVQKLTELLDPLFQMLPFGSLFGRIIEDMEIPVFCVILVKPARYRGAVDFIRANRCFSFGFKLPVVFEDKL